VGSHRGLLLRLFVAGLVCVLDIREWRGGDVELEEEALINDKDDDAAVLSLLGVDEDVC
jgi:hypothetical protein